MTIHDIRRTVADALLNRLQVPPRIVDHVVLGHARPKLLRTFMPTLPLAEAREGLRRWSEHLDVILGSHPDVPVLAERAQPVSSGFLLPGAPTTERQPVAAMTAAVQGPAT